MTQAQKTAKAKFKQAIAYRTKTGVSLKEAFAHIYGKKKVAKKTVRKKAAKKRIAGPKDSSAVKRELARKGLKMPHGYTTTKRKRKISGVKKKKITEKGILNKIHIVKRNFDKLDEAQHKHMMNGVGKLAIEKYQKVQNDIIALEKALIRNLHQMKQFQYKTPFWKQRFKLANAKLKSYIKELKIHAKELKKHI